MAEVTPLCQEKISERANIVKCLPKLAKLLSIQVQSSKGLEQIEHKSSNKAVVATNAKIFPGRRTVKVVVQAL